MHTALASRTWILGIAFTVTLPFAVQAADLSLKRVMLSSAGVGYFEYEAEVDGATELGLDVPLEQVDDVLKSLVVFDSAGGVGGIALPGRDGTRAAFGDVPFGPEALQSPVAYLNALQGVEVTVRGPQPMRGRILRAEPVSDAVGPPGNPAVRVAQRTRVSLLGADGLRQFVLEDAESVQIDDTVLRERIGKALDTLRRAAGRDMRHITLRATGTGKRIVRVGYVAAAPLWKASYRLVLPAAGSGKARLQGWAVLENQTGTDWNGVALSLQYGNPVTFRQALYRSYFVQRPEVPVEVLGRILPDVDTRARAVPPPPPSPAGGALGRAMERRDLVTLAAPASAPPAQPMDNMAAPAEQAQTAEGTEQTTFRLATPVVLTAGQSASVPILDQELDAERLAFATGARRNPLASIRIGNSGDLSLPAGVLTLYDPTGEAAFAGDARLGGLPAGQRRLLSFAEDLRSTVERKVSATQSLLSITASQGVLRLAHRDRRVETFILNAPPREARRMLVEIPKDGDRTISLEGAAPAGLEETATAWRVAVDLKPGEVRTLNFWLDSTVREEIGLLNTDTSSILVRVLTDRNLPAAARQALERVAALRQDEANKRNEIARLIRDIEAVERNEDRIRRNLAAVPVGDALHTRLTRQLDADETKIAGLRQSIEQVTQAADAARKVYADAVTGLKL